MRTGAAIVGFLVVAAIGFAVGYSVGRNAQEPRETQAPPPAQKPQGQNGKIERVPIGDSPARGADDAPVTIVELSELGCPFCARAASLMKVLEARFGKDLRFVWKTTGRTTKPELALATELALAANAEHKFWELHDRFATASDLDEAKVRSVAQELGLDVDALLASGRGRAMVAADRTLADKLELTETPAYFINGERVGMLESASVLERMVETARANANKMIAAGVPAKDVYDAITAGGQERPFARRDVRPPPQSDARQQLARVPDAPVKGALDPRVTIVEFSDFASPFCGRANAALDKALEDYPNDVAIQFRFAPVSQNERAVPAAKAAIAAHQQQKFWAYHDLLFASPGTLSDDDLKNDAKAIGLQMSKFDLDRQLSAADAIIERDHDEGVRIGVRGTPTIFVNGIPMRGVQTYAALKAVIDSELAREEPAAKTAPPKFDTTRSPRRGARDAKVALVLFNDFECPACKKLPPLLDRLLTEHGNDVAVVYKQYPLPTHAKAELASVAVLAAHRQGKFIEMHDQLFAHQDALARDDLVAHARAIGIDADRFAKDLDDPELRRAVKADIAEGVKLGVTGTPTLFIGAKRLEGLKTYEEVLAAVAAALRST